MVKTLTKTKEDQRDKTIKICKGIQKDKTIKICKGIQKPGKTIIWIGTNIQIVHLF